MIDNVITTPGTNPINMPSEIISVVHRNGRRGKHVKPIKQLNCINLP